MTRLRNTFAAAVVILAVAAAVAQEFEIPWYTIDGGGGTSAGGDFELSGTAGQPNTGEMTGEEFALSGGFWFTVEPGDCDQDGDVDLADFLVFQECFMGSGSGAAMPGCGCSDFDGDGDVDLGDLITFQAHFTGTR